MGCWLCLMVFPVIVCAGTFVDEFNDGDYEGWTLTFARTQQAPESIVSVDDGVVVLRLGYPPHRW